MAIDPAHEDLLNRVLESFESGDGHRAAALYEPDAIYHLYPEAIKGREAIAESMAAWFTAFPNITWELVNLMSSGDTFIAEGIFRGTHNGPMQTDQGEIPPTGKSVEVPCCFIGRVSENGMIAEDRTYFNAAIMMEQLGIG